MTDDLPLTCPMCIEAEKELCEECLAIIEERAEMARNGELTLYSLDERLDDD